MDKTEMKPDKKGAAPAAGGFFRTLAGRDAVYIAALVVVNFIWFSFIKYRTLMGDDIFALHNLGGYRSALDAFTDFSAAKYRPVFQLIDYVLFSLAGYNYSFYLAVNIVFNAVMICAVYKTLDHIVENKYAAFVFSMAFLTSRFSYYNIMQQLGLMEALGLFCFVAIIYCSVRYMNEGGKNYAVFAAALSCIIPFIHERFIVVPVMFSLLMAINGKGLKPALMTLTLSSAALNVLVKTAVFKGNFLQGTAGQAIDLTNAPVIANYFLKGLLNMLGINAGPRYLAGIYFEKMRPDVIVSSSLIFVFSLAVIILYLVQTRKNRKVALLSVDNFAAALFFVMLMTASVCIRQEFRWLYAPYFICLALFAVCVKKVFPSARQKYAYLSAFMALSIYSNIYHRDHLGDFYLTYAQKSADSLYAAVFDRNENNTAAGYDLYIQDFTHRPWITGNGLFFEIYSGKKTAPRVHYFEKTDDLKILGPAKDARIIVFDPDSVAFREIDPAGIGPAKGVVR